MALSGPGREELLNEGLASVGHHGDSRFLPREHATFEIDDIKTLRQQEFGGSPRTATRAAGADNLSIAGKLVEAVGELGEANVDGVGSAPIGKLVVLTDVDEKSAIANEGHCFV